MFAMLGHRQFDCNLNKFKMSPTQLLIQQYFMSQTCANFASSYTVVICRGVSFNDYLNNDLARTLKKVTHIKGRLLDQAVILFNWVPFHNENFSERKELAPRGSQFFPLKAVHYGMENHFYHIW